MFAWSKSRKAGTIWVSLAFLTGLLLILAAISAEHRRSHDVPRPGPRNQDLLKKRERAQKAMPRKTGSEVSYDPQLRRNISKVRFIVPGRGEMLVPAPDEAAFLKPYQDAVDAANGPLQISGEAEARGK